VVFLTKPNGTAIAEGSVVTAIHDTRQGQIEFHVNGKSLGIAFSNIHHDKRFAAADPMLLIRLEFPYHVITEDSELLI
jgi:hypothetical protein